jgi:hypothetical protein
MRKSGGEVKAPAKHRLQLWTSFLPAPGEIGKSRLGGELRREEERYLGRGSARIGTGLSMTSAKGVFACHFPQAHARPESHMS